MNKKQSGTPETLKPLPVAGELNESALNKVSGGFKIDGIKGESTDQDHKDEIQVLSFK
ncbi:MAG TPA: type VI secretion system tube protein Hcp [Dongiaceae bacterium]